MAVDLIPMSEAAYPLFFELASASYAADNAATGRWLEAEAPALARAELQRLLPLGASTPQHVLMTVLAPALSPALAAEVGYVWYGEVARGSQRVAFLFQLLIRPEYRGQGYGRAALQAFEALARSQGCHALGLNVFATNQVARRLYASSGYRELSIGMGKPLAGPGSDGRAADLPSQPSPASPSA